MKENIDSSPTGKPLLSKRFPLPSKVELFNLLPTSRATSTTAASKWFRPEYSSSLLETVHLQIVITENNRDRILLERSCVQTVHPGWQHLNEFLDPSSLSIENYESMRFRFLLEDASVLEELQVHPAKVMRIPAVPQKLPLNAIIVHYTDSTIRVSPSLHACIKQQLAQQTIPDYPKNKSEQNNDDFHRFQEQAFRTLDQVTPQRGRQLPPSLEVGLTAEHTAPTKIAEHEKDTPMDDLDLSQAELTRISAENEMLEQLVKAEELELEEIMKFSEETDKIQKLIQSTEKMEQQTEEVDQAAREDTKGCYKMDLMLEAQRIRLIKSLCEVYPITTKDDSTGCQRFFIRGLEVPRDPHSISEEEVAAALGFLCHLVLMLSKYLDIPLRFRMFSQASRSAIQDDARAVYPLFSGRNVERDQFETGCRLLGLNVTCLCKRRGIECNTEPNVLGKVRRLMDGVVHGSFKGYFKEDSC